VVEEGTHGQRGGNLSGVAVHGDAHARNTRASQGSVTAEFARTSSRREALGCRKSRWKRGRAVPARLVLAGR
jgi:hypothetical protein